MVTSLEMSLFHVVKLIHRYNASQWENPVQRRLQGDKESRAVKLVTTHFLSEHVN